MKLDIKEQWIAALRSGNYVQGRNTLHAIDYDGYEDRFCCLGVLCDLAVEAGAVKRQRIDEDGVFVYGEYDTRNYLPPAVMEWAGLVTEDPIIIAFNPDDGDNDTYTLSTLNDGQRWSFDRIADVIQAQL